MSKSRKKSKKKSNAFLIVLIVIAAVLLGVVGFGLWKMFDIHRQSNYTPDDEVTYSVDPAEEASMDSEFSNPSIYPDDRNPSQESLEPMTEPAKPEADTYNLLLVGVDRRDRTWNGNSDTMILVTVNHDMKKIFLTSFQRDLYAEIDGIGVRKLNHAYAVGGGPLLMTTLRKNYGVQVDNYASVDFFSMIEIIDIFGGVDIDITQAEAKLVNAFMDDLSKTLGITKVNHIPTTGGLTHMDGLAALSYSRNRSIGNDAARTQRQRNVINAAFGKAKTMSITDLVGKINEIVPHVLHNVSTGELTRLTTMLPTCLKYSTQEVRVPFDGEYKSYNEVKTPYSMEATRKKIRSIIYGE